MSVTGVQTKSEKKTVPRKIEKPLQYLKEKAWFNAEFSRPDGAPDPCKPNEIEDYEKLIWEMPSMWHCKKYGCTVGEMAVLCGQDESNGMLKESQIKYLMTLANERSQHCLCVFIPSMSYVQVQELYENSKNTITRLVFVISVGKNPDGSVFIATTRHPEYHFVTVFVDLSDQVVYYCDSLGWDVPTAFIETLEIFTQAIKLPSFKEASVIPMHVSSIVGGGHCCSDLCQDYPLSHGSVCSIVTLVTAIMATLDKSLFQRMIAKDTPHKLVLHNPKKYERYLRRILISWFINGDINLSNLNINLVEAKSNTTEADHSYHSPFSLKRSTRTAGIDKTSKYPMIDKFKCKFCGLSFRHSTSLSRHRKTVHQSLLPPVNPGICCCIYCDEFKSAKIKDLIKHYSEIHCQNIQVFSQTFANEEEFKKWKTKVEIETFTRYIQIRGSERKGNSIRKYYTCHRSGNYKRSGKGLRKSRVGSTYKIGSKCTSFVKIWINLQGSVYVEYCLEHIGHSALKPENLSIPKEMSSTITGKLLQGDEVETVFDAIRNSVSDVNTSNSLIAQGNITTHYNASLFEKDKDDDQSVYLWVQEFQKQADNPIIYYKAKNSPHEMLAEQDFLLCIQNDFQRSMLLEHGCKIICSDSVQTTTENAISLTTVFVLDDSQEGIPVAWAISNREYAKMLEVFIAAIKLSCNQVIETEILMSDMSIEFYNAWCKVFPKPLKRFYGFSHVERSVRQKIDGYFRIEQKRCMIYSLFKQLQEETDETKFKKMLEDFLCYVKIHTSFHQYFKHHFVKDNKVLLWSACFRSDGLRGANAFMEDFRAVMKNIYFDNENQNNRMDHLLVVLIRLARDKAMELLINPRPARTTHQAREVEENSVSVSINQARQIIIDVPQTQNVMDVDDGNVGYSFVSEFQENECQVYIEQDRGVYISDVKEANTSHDENAIAVEVERMQSEVSAAVSGLLDACLKCRNVDSLRILYSKVKEITTVADTLE